MRCPINKSKHSYQWLKAWLKITDPQYHRKKRWRDWAVAWAKQDGTVSAVYQDESWFSGNPRLVRGWMGPLRSRKPVGVIQELYGMLLAHYVVRSLMHEAALRTGLDPDRLSFISSLRIIRRAIPEFQQAAPECLPLLYERLLDDIAREKLPPRRDRSNPRVVKHKMSKFKLKRSEHKAWPQPSMPFADAIVILGQP